MKKMGLCHICGRLAYNVCSLCGRPACDEHFDKEHNICTSCKLGNMTNKSNAANR